MKCMLFLFDIGEKKLYIKTIIAVWLLKTLNIVHKFMNNF